MNIRGKSSISILLYTLIIAFMAVSCSPNTTELIDEPNLQDPEINVSDSDELLSFYKGNSVNSVIPDESTPLKKEIEGLIYIIEPSLNSKSNYFIGNENKEYIEEKFLYPDNTYFLMTVGDWNKVISVLFTAGTNEDVSIMKYLPGYKDSDLLSRQDAISSLINLLASIPSITIEEDTSAMQKSYVLSDLEEVSEEKQLLIRNAFCLGFTDLNVESTKTFQPNNYLNRNDSVSILYRVFSNLGFPITTLPQDDNLSLITETEPTLYSEELFSIEKIYNEYNTYMDDLTKRGKSADKKRIDMLNKADSILTKDAEIELHTPVLSKEKFIRILHEVFGLEQEEIDIFLTYDTGDAISFDSAAIVIFTSSNLLGQATPKEATNKELEEARALIPQFDTAIDVNTLSQMLSSGLLNGIYQIPGFTPKRPVSNTEALILVKRIIESMSIY